MKKNTAWKDVAGIIGKLLTRVCVWCNFHVIMLVCAILIHSCDEKRDGMGGENMMGENVCVFWGVSSSGDELHSVLRWNDWLPLAGSRGNRLTHFALGWSYFCILAQRRDRGWIQTGLTLQGCGSENGVWLLTGMSRDCAQGLDVPDNSLSNTRVCACAAVFVEAAAVSWDMDEPDCSSWPAYTRHFHHRIKQLCILLISCAACGIEFFKIYFFLQHLRN